MRRSRLSGVSLARLNEMSSSTRRVLVPIAWPTGKVSRGHLLPDLRSRTRTSFVRVPGGREVSHGMVAFVGKPVSARDMFSRWESSVGDIAQPQEALDLLEGYVRWASTQKLGSVFEAAYDSRGMLVARKVANSFPTSKSPIPE